VSYFHAGGIDRPLVITKDGQSIIPHQNWRGQFARGTYPSGTRSDYPPGVTSGCTPIQWPGERTSARHELEPDPNIQNWFGGLVDGMRDASGQMYKRNRYYDPKTGQFTQPDPIGLAGGLNAYGFADGDPVSYSDPYGLCRTIRGSIMVAGAMAASDLVSPLGDAAGVLCIVAAVGVTAFAAIRGTEGVADLARDDGSPARRRMQIHHIATNKNSTSSAGGGPWTPVFQPMFDRAGVDIDGPENKVGVEGHRGPHPEAYHRAVYQALTAATAGASNDAEYRTRFRAALNALRVRIATRGTDLNRLVTGGER
jgi:RHS repeat-associated protein